MLRRLSGHLHQNVVAYLALFVALGGTSAWAAGQISGTQVKDESLTGADVLDDSLRGADVVESTLGSVPHAAKAGDADTVDGKDSSDFLQAATKVADADKLDGAVDTAVAAREETISIRPEFGEPGRETVTVSCPDDGIALSGSHTEVFIGGDSARVFDTRYDRTSYSVSYEALTSTSGRVVLSARCLMGASP